MPLLDRKKNKTRPKVQFANLPNPNCAECQQDHANQPTVAQPATPNQMAGFFGFGKKSKKGRYYRSKNWKPTPLPAFTQPTTMLVYPTASPTYVVPQAPVYPQATFAPIAYPQAVVKLQQQNIAFAAPQTTMPMGPSYFVTGQPQVYNGVWYPRDERLPQQRITEIV